MNFHIGAQYRRETVGKITIWTLVNKLEHPSEGYFWLVFYDETNKRTWITNNRAFEIRQLSFVPPPYDPNQEPEDDAL